MSVLIVGGGGREHAFAWKIAQSARVGRIWVAPGNAGTAREPKCENVAIGAEDVESLLEFARRRKVDLTVVGPEAPLVAGIVDRFNAAGLRCFGPSARAARLEGSKAYAKDFLARYRIPTAGYGTFERTDEAIGFIRQLGAPVVVKADGLAAGKGVIVAQTEDEAVAAVRDMLEARTFGAAGARVVIEEFLEGEEASFIAMIDGTHVLALATSQDHKRALDGDRGPNTGGMGAYSPAPVVTAELHARVLREVMEPTVRGLQAEGEHYVGFLYAGLMIAADGTPRVLEFNCRFGDPETQPVLMRLRSDLVDLILAALEGRLDGIDVRWDSRVALGVVMAAGGYPGTYNKGDAIAGLPADDAGDVKVFHAGTAERDGKVLTSGGRVLCVTALGATVAAAQARAYEVVRRIRWRDVHYRTDIGYRAIARTGS
ncbi:phosphoribosylamine--glycine ligase [Sulfurifustis variabilis]|uniref:phosphoribosylamine--glycine ligase n=1 Tax=Sulfurifustis variabilis TaxID=1675686 RepID=UPI000BBABA26